MVEEAIMSGGTANRSGGVIENSGKRAGVSASCHGDLRLDLERIREAQGGFFFEPWMGSTSPLGLKLSKTPSFMELIDSKLSKKTRSSSPASSEADQSGETASTEAEKKARRKKEAEKWKASNWNAKLLKIGDWERHSMRDLDLVAKCYYAKKKLVWEMLENGLKKKIEFQWNDIVAIRAAFPENQNAVLEIQLKNPPTFFQETNPQPRKHTTWHSSPDFTNNQASLCGRHYLLFEEGTLQPHYEKLLECDKRLLFLSQRPFPVNRSAYFSLNLSGNQDYIDYNSPHLSFSMPQYLQHGVQQPNQVPFQGAWNGVQQPNQVSFQGAWNGVQQPTHVPFQGVGMSEPTVRPPVGPQASFDSPDSVMDFTLVEDRDAQARAMMMHMHMQNNGHQQVQYPSSQSDYQQVQVQYPGSQSCYQQVQYPQLLSSRGQLPGPSSFDSSDMLLRNVSNQMFYAPDPVTTHCDDEQLMAKINSISNLLDLPHDQVADHNACPSEAEYNHGSDSASNDHEGLMADDTLNWQSVDPCVDLRGPGDFQSLYSSEEFAAKVSRMR